MQFAQFLEKINQFKNFSDRSSSSIFLIFSEDNNNLFNSLICKFFRESNFICSSLSATEIGLEELKLKLSTNFLGYFQIYFVKDLQLVKQETKAKLINFLKNYSGPNKLIIFSSYDEQLEKEFSSSLIKLPNKIDLDTYKKICDTFYTKITFNDKFRHKLFAHQKSISLDLACILIRYQSVLGKAHDAFFDDWFNKLTEPVNSLFDLSHALFSKEAKDFFQLWFLLKKKYPEEFWIAYWSEQLWQASLFVLRANKQSLIYAKNKAQKLPFSFINKNWHNYSLSFLSQAHNNLYQFDYKFKNGGASDNLELWYYKFLLDQFK